MLRINERNRVCGEDIHTAIESRNKNYRGWLNDKIQYADLQEGKDFFATLLKSTGGRPKTQYEFTIEAVKLICLLEKNNTSKDVYKWICSIDNKECIIYHKTRKELLFEICLTEILQGIEVVIPQYKVLNYRIDFYLPNLNIAIEYDEKHHIQKKHKDIKRQKDIEREIKNIKFIRVNEGEENYGINSILKSAMKEMKLTD